MLFMFIILISVFTLDVFKENGVWKNNILTAEMGTKLCLVL